MRLPPEHKAPWTVAIRDEWNSLMKSKTFRQSSISRARRLTPVIMTSRWLFKRKADGQADTLLSAITTTRPPRTGISTSPPPTP
jgi:hypothetical protein